MKKPHPSYQIALCAMVGLACCFQTVSAEVRTWTSTSGATMEAEFVRVDAGQAVLRSSKGNELAIPLSKLSPADQAYVKTSVSGTSTVTKPTAPSAPLVSDNKTNAPAGKLFTYKDALPLAGGLPASIKLRQPNDARFMLVQYGPEPGEVLYVVFDPPEPRVTADAAYVWSPSLIGFQTPRRIVGKTRKMNNTMAFVFEIPVSTQFGDLSVKGKIELISGVQDWWLYAVAGSFDVVKGGKSSSFMVSGYLNDVVVSITELPNAKPVRLLTDIRLLVSTNPGNGQTDTGLEMGAYKFIPGRNMMSEIKVVFMDEKGGKAEEHRMKINKDDLLNIRVGANSDKLKKGEKYSRKATIDLGPVFGMQVSELTFTMH